MFKLIKKTIFFGLIVGLLISFVLIVFNVLQKAPFLKIKEVKIVGVIHTDRKILENIFYPYLGKNIFSRMNFEETIEVDPWIVRLEVRRILPNQLLVYVWEDRAIIDFKLNGLCYTYTELGSRMPRNCDGVKVILQNFSNAEFDKFLFLYDNNELLQSNEIILNNSFFWLKEGSITIKGSLVPGVFANNYSVYIEKIKPNYNTIERVDLTVDGKVYVKGVLNGKRESSVQR